MNNIPHALIMSKLKKQKDTKSISITMKKHIHIVSTVQIVHRKEVTKSQNQKKKPMMQVPAKKQMKS